MAKQTENMTSATKSVRKSSAGWIIKNLSVVLDTEMNRQLKPLGIKLPQFAILMTLFESDGLTQVEIGKQIAMPGYGTTRNLDILETAGLTKRQPHETSRRSLRVYLTKKGKTLAPELFQIVNNVNRLLLSTLTTTETKQFEKILNKLLKEHRLADIHHDNIKENHRPR